VVSDSPPHQRLSGALGSAEIQAAAPPRQAGAAVPGERRPTGAGAVRSLAVGAAVRLGTGSRVSREGHARFCERPGVQLARSTLLVAVFQDYGDALRFRQEMEERLRAFGLKVAPEKTAVLRFDGNLLKGAGRPTVKPASFTFLGFTHYLTKT